MENINLIRKIAWSFHRTTKVEWDDLFQEAALAYCEALKDYDPERGKISGYMWSVIANHLKSYLDKQEQLNKLLCSIEDNPVDVPISSTPFFESLSREANQIADVILTAPKPFRVRSPKRAHQRIVKILRNKGWSWRRVRIGIADLKLAFN